MKQQACLKVLVVKKTKIKYLVMKAVDGYEEVGDIIT